MVFGKELVPRKSNLPLPRSIDIPWELQALPLYFSLYDISSGSRGDYSNIGYMQRLFCSSSPCSALHLATSAAADANALYKLTDSRAIIHARQTYVQALTAVQQALNDPVLALEDSTLCALQALTLFEVSC